MRSRALLQTAPHAQNMGVDPKVLYMGRRLKKRQAKMIFPTKRRKLSMGPGKLINPHMSHNQNPGPCKELRRRISAAIYGKGSSLTNLHLPGF